MSTRVVTVDAFTSKPFSGNPAAVCILQKAADERWMQTVASEMNLSETAFLHPEESGYRLRWFTPKAEVKLCGHATLASAHVLWEEGHSTAGRLEFHTLSGLLTAERIGKQIELNFPAEAVEEIEVPSGLIDALGVEPILTGKTPSRYFVEIASAHILRNLKPDISGIQRHAPGRVIVTAHSDTAEFDFISRYFAPGVGVAEDPVTGSAHCALATYWAAKLGKNQLRAYQASERGGEMGVVLEGERVRLLGQAVTVMQAELL